MDRVEARRRARRQERVAKVVWGSLFVVMGVLFTLHDMGRIDLGEPPNKFLPQHAVDGDTRTRWSSAFHEGQSLTVDLGAPTSLSKVRIQWEDAYAKEYELQTSENGRSWSTALHVKDGKGGLDEQELRVTTRYLRLAAITRATPYGISVWEVQAFDPSGALVSQGKRATASSIEDDNPFALWFKFWPLTFIAGGLPLLLAPRDDVSQVFGMILTAIGAYAQLRTLGYVDLGVRQAAAAVLIVAGAIILLQSQRRGEDGTGQAGSGS